MPDIAPQLVALLKEVADRDGWVIEPGVCIPTTAEDINNQSGAELTGRYHPAFEGAAHGGFVPLYQDMPTATGVTGSGFINSNAANPFVSTTGKKVYLWPNGSANATFDGTCALAGSNTTLPSMLIVVKRGKLPASVTPTSANFWTRLILADGDPHIAFSVYAAYGKPVTLDKTVDGGTTWSHVYTLPGAPGGEQLWAQYGDDREVTFHILPDYKTNTLRVEVGNGLWLRCSPVLAGTNTRQDLPTTGKVRLMGENGFAKLEVYPGRFAPVTVVSTAHDFGAPVTGTVGVIANGRIAADSSQTDAVSLAANSDNSAFRFQVTASKADAGEGLGSATPPVFSDACLVREFLWSDSGIPGDTAPYTPRYLKCRRVEIEEFLDDHNRCLQTRGTLFCDNSDGRFNGGFGNRAIDIAVGNGSVSANYFSGLAGVGEEGVQTVTLEALKSRLAIIALHDKSFAMQHGVKTARQYDQWCRNDAFRFEAQLGNIHPKYMTGIASYVPYGKADGAVPTDFILPTGTGNQARYLFDPNTTAWEGCRTLTMDAGFITTGGASIPYYYGFTYDGNLNFQPYDPTALTSAVAFTQADMVDITVTSSIADLRTDLDFQGINAFTYQLMNAHVEQPLWLKKLVGFRAGWLERNARYATPSYIISAINIGAVVAATPSVIARFRANNLNPNLHAGMRVTLSDSTALGGTLDGYIIYLKTVCGEMDITCAGGAREAYQIFAVRTISPFAPSTGGIDLS